MILGRGSLVVTARRREKRRQQQQNGLEVSHKSLSGLVGKADRGPQGSGRSGVDESRCSDFGILGVEHVLQLQIQRRPGGAYLDGSAEVEHRIGAGLDARIAWLQRLDVE